MWIHQHNRLESSRSWHNSLQDFHNLTHPMTQMTFDLHLKTTCLMYSMHYTYKPNMRSVQASLLEISCLQGFHHLTYVDPKWPLTSTKNNRLLVLNRYTYILNMRSVQAFLLEISCLQGFHNLTPVDPKWPLTSTKTNRLLVLNKVHLHTKYEICPSFPSWDIVFTRFSQFDPCWPQMTFDLHQKQ